LKFCPGLRADIRVGALASPKRFVRFSFELVHELVAEFDAISTFESGTDEQP